MFFSISKLFWAVISPANLILLLLLAGVIIRRFRKILLGTAIALFLILGVLPVGHNLLYILESADARPAQITSTPAGIIVLGGAIDTSLSARYGTPETGESTERILEALALARQYPEAQLVFSGGDGRLVKSGTTEADVTRGLLKSIGFTHRQIIFEDHSRNTIENASFTHDLLEPAEGEKWIVVTSAYHMKRALETFAGQGWDADSLVPWPVDYRTEGRLRLWPARFNVLENLYLSDLALHEYVGWIAYAIFGKTPSRS